MEELRHIKSYRALVPIWQTASSLRLKQVRLGACSDHGCSGLDITVTSNDEISNDSCVDVITIKEQTNKHSLSARECCIPFMSPNQESDLTDHCLGEIDAEQAKEKLFIKDFTSKIRNRKRYYIKLLEPIWIKLQDEELRNMLLDGNVLLHKGVVDLVKKFSHSFPAPKTNWLYAGNGMSVTSNKALLHSGGLETSDLNVTPLSEDNIGDLLFSGIKSQKVKLKGGPIHGITCKQPMGTDTCLVRKKRNIHILMFQDDVAECVTRFKSKVDVASATLNPYFVGEYALLNTKGDLELHTFTHNVPIFKSSVSHSGTSEIEQHWICDFGAHPRALLYLDKHKLSLADLRGTRRKTFDVFQSDNRILFEPEQLFMFQQSRSNPFQYYVSTTHHLLVADERFPNVPVQFWKHQLSSFPLLLWQGMYGDPDGSTDNSFVILACHRPQETCCFQVRPATPQPISLSPPWFCSTPQDPCKVLRHYGIPVPETYASRSAFPVTGVCSVPHNNGLTIFHQTSLGDLFCQDYFFPSGMEDERTHRFGPGYVPTNADRLSQRLLNWVQDVQLLADTPMDFPHFEWTKPSLFFDGLLENRSAPESCRFCIPGDSGRQELVVKCSSCHLNSESAEAICHGMKELGSLATGELLKNSPSKSELQWLFQLTNLRREFDPFTRSLLKEWNTSEMETSSVAVIQAAASQHIEAVLDSKSTPNRTSDNPGDISTNGVSSSDINLIDLTEGCESKDIGSFYNNLSADDRMESTEKRGSEVLSDDDCDIIPPSQSSNDQRRKPPVKRLSFLQNRKINTAGF